MTKDEALKLALEACPFCGGEAEYQKENVRSGYGEYERNETYHTIRCKKCGASSKRVHQKHLIDFTKYTVRDFRENPILRAKVEDDYDAYCEQSKQLAIDAWSLRTAIKQALNDATHLAAPYVASQLVQELVCVCGAVWQGQELVETPAAQPAPNCTRSHPHENMDAMCELRTEIARLTNENARLKAAAPAQEPVAWMWTHKTAGKVGVYFEHPSKFFDLTKPSDYKWTPLYTTPPNVATPLAAQRQWVGLTPREIYNLWEDSGVPFVDWDSFASITRAIEAKLRNKNGWRQQHVTDGNPCWCEPETRYTDPETGASVIVHKDPQ